MTSVSVTRRNAVFAFLLIVWHLKAVQRVLLGVAVVVVLLLAVQHYGNHTSPDEGYTVGSDTGVFELGFETVGDVGVFGHVKTVLGSLDLFDGAVSWCPAGASDVECGA